ncbi:MAG: ABC transporter substrate-binding protein [Finegoldia sp.]|nr:ABC transporter substrate-binding protein [Finegoldia sp.]
MKNKSKLLAMILVCTMMATGCKTSVDQSQDQQASQSGQTEEKSQENKTEEKKEESKGEEKKEEAKNVPIIAEPASEKFPYIEEETFTPKFTAADIGITEEDLKAEPMYGKEITIMAGSGCTCAPVIANLQGKFAEHAIKANVTKTQANFNEALANDQAQVCVNHIAESIVPISNDLDVYYKSGAISGCLSLYVLSDSGYEKTTDLKGKIIGTNEVGGNLYNVAIRFLARDGVSKDEVKLKPVETASSVVAMQNGEIDAVMLSDQFANPFVKDGTLKRIRSLSYDEDFHIEPCCTNLFSGKFVRENPKHAELINQIIKDAQAWIEENEEETVQMLTDNNYLSGKQDLVITEFKSYSWTLPDKNVEETIENMINDYKEFGLIRSDVDTKQLMEKCWKPAEKDSMEGGMKVSPNEYSKK